MKIRDDVLKISVIKLFVPFSDPSNHCIDLKWLSKIIYVGINADLSANLSKYKTIQILLGNCICTLSVGIKLMPQTSLKSSRLWQLGSDRMMYDGLCTLLQNVNWQFMRGFRKRESHSLNREQHSDRELYGRVFIDSWLMQSEFASLHSRLLYLVSAKC